jgi:hypothetical protein
MKHLYTLLFVLFFIVSSYSRACQVPMSFRDFGFVRSQLLQNMNPSRQYQLAMDIARNNCFTSTQVEELATLLANDRDRIDFCKMAFNNTVDRENFEEVYDAFISFSAALRLYKHLNGLPPNNVVITQQPPQVIYNYTYPNLQTYNGRFGCNGYINDVTFRQLKQQIITSGNEATMFNMAKNFTTHYCMSVGQIMEIAALFNTEAFRWDLIQSASANIYDLDNYTYFDQVFSSQQFRDRCRGLYATRQNPIAAPTPAPPVQRCEVANAEFDDIKNSINKISFNSSKESQLKSITRGRCFSVEQIKQLLNLFSFESSKLELAKYLYEFCIDKQNYFRVNEVFSFSSSVDDLNRFIQTR